MIAKARKALWFAAIRLVSPVHPRTGTRLALAFYRRTSMTIDGKGPTFIASSAWLDGTRDYAPITLGDGCLLSRDVRVLTHDWSPFTAFRSFGRGSPVPVGRISPVVIGAHAFVGLGAIVMAGSTIGRGAIVGAGAVVRGVVPDGVIVAGNPAVMVGKVADHLARNYPDEWANVMN